MKRLFSYLTSVVVVAFWMGAAPISSVAAAGNQAVPLNSSEKVPFLAPAAAVSVSAPSTIPLGQDVAFSVTFDNTGADPGYGPFVEIVLDRTGADGVYPGTPAANAYDGLGTTNALTVTYLGGAIPSSDIYVVNFNASGNVTHPLVRDSSGTYITVNAATYGASPGDKMIVVRLPFGSFTPDQPAATINLTVNMSNLADIGVPLHISARGGYQYGQTPLDDFCCGDLPADTLGAVASTSVLPTLLTASKVNDGPEGETATGPNFPRTYALTVDIAPGQTITNLTIADALPNNIQFVSATSSPGETSSTLPSTSTPGGMLALNYASISSDVTAIVDFYVPRLDLLSGQVIDPDSGDDVNSVNTISVTGNWLPVDTRDRAPASPFTVSVTGDCPGCPDTLVDKSIAIQKSVSVVGGGEPSAGSVLEYTLNFQISDFFAFDNVVITDIISDGQRLSSVPTLEINGNGYTIAAVAFDPDHYDIFCHYTVVAGGGTGAECETNTGASGVTDLTFRVSDQIEETEPDGVLLGGCVNPGGGLVSPCSTLGAGDGPTTGTIVFRTTIQQRFSDDYPSGDPSVDQGDTLNNNVDIYGDVLDISSLLPNGNTEDDGSSASITAPTGLLTKSIYAINGSTSFTSPVRVKPGDDVTYRLTYAMPFSDEENLELKDYLPLPVFDVSDPDADGAAGPAWSFDPTVSAAAPASGVAKFGPSDTFFAYSGITPALTSSALDNELIFTYGDFDDPADIGTLVDILFTVTISAEPFADGLYLTNQAHSFEGSTNGSLVQADAIVQLIITEPVLTTTKTVFWTDSLSAEFSSPVGGSGVSILPPANAPRWSGNINSSYLVSNPLNADISQVDAGDIISFAIIIENSGSSLKGAFDLHIQDALQDQFDIPAGGLNLQVYYGNGTGPISYITLASSCTGTWPGDPCGPDGALGTPDDLFGAGIQLVDPVGQGVCQAHDPNLGNNVILVTYDLQIESGVTPGDIINTASLLNYAGEEGGPNHLSTPEQDDAVTSVNTTPIKYLVATSEAHTLNADVVVGEIIRYRVVTSIPESTTTNLQIRDRLPNGMIFLNDGSARVGFVSEGGVSSSSTGTLPVPGIPGACMVSGSAADASTPASLPCALDDANVGSSSSTAINLDSYAGGTDVYFKLGDVVNAEADSNAEYAIIEFNALVYNGAASQNDNGDTLSNTARVTVTGSNVQLGSDSTAVVATVREPRLTLDKTNSAISATVDAGDTVIYTITIVNDSTAPANSTATAFDVHFEDTLPSADLALVLSSVNVTGGSGVTDNSTGNKVDIIIGNIAIDETVIITYEAVVNYSILPGQAVDNTGNLTWTSLPGPNGTSSNPTGSTTPGAPGSDTGERDSSDGSGGPTDDYAAIDTSTFSTTGILPIKSIVSTSEAHTSESGDGSSGNPRDLVIGEIVRYRLSVQLAEGTTTDLEILDTLPAGFTFLNDGTARISFLADNDVTEDLDLGGADNDALPASFVIPSGRITSAGQDVTFSIGTIVNNDDDTDQEYVVVEFNALVNNDANNNNTDLDNNDFVVIVNGVSVSTSNSVGVRILEPVLTLAKSVSDDHPAPGQVVTFTLVLENIGSVTAHDVDMIDNLPTELALNLGSVAATSSGVVSGISDSSTASQVHITAVAMAPGSQLIVTYQAAVNASLNDIFVNAAEATWTSLPGPAGTQVNPTGSTPPGNSGDGDGERNGDGGLNDYSASAAVTLTSDRNLVKNLIASNLSSTSFPDDVTIGEILTYQIILTIPAGSTDTAIITDTLDEGLAFVDCNEPGGAGLLHDITAGPGITSTTMTFNSDAHGHNAASCSHGTASGSNPLVSNNGRTLQFNFGDITNSSASAEEITITYRVVVLDIAANVQNQGVLLDNDVEFSWSTGSISASASPAVNIVEPDLSIEKTVDPTVAALGSLVTYSIFIDHTSESQTTAYDVVLADTIPSGLVLNELSVQVSVTGGPLGQSVTTTPSSITVRWDEFPLGATALVTFEAAFIGPAPVINSANVEWSTLQIDPAPRFAQISAYNQDSTERRYDPLASAGPNSYIATSSVLLTVPPYLPRTGFAPGQVTHLPQQPRNFNYQALGEVWLEIPSLGVKLDIVGVPFFEKEWNLTWLNKNAGWLEGTAFPTYQGNSGITAHAYLADGTPGPFANLEKLRYGNQIIIRFGGTKYIYEVRQTSQVRPSDVKSVLKHEERSWITLITCKTYSEREHDYLYRSVVRAVLISTVDE